MRVSTRINNILYTRNIINIIYNINIRGCIISNVHFRFQTHIYFNSTFIHKNISVTESKSVQYTTYIYTCTQSLRCLRVSSCGYAKFDGSKMRCGVRQAERICLACSNALLNVVITFTGEVCTITSRESRKRAVRRGRRRLLGLTVFHIRLHDCNS